MSGFKNTLSGFKNLMRSTVVGGSKFGDGCLRSLRFVSTVSTFWLGERGQLGGFLVNILEKEERSRYIKAMPSAKLSRWLP